MQLQNYICFIGIVINKKSNSYGVAFFIEILIELNLTGKLKLSII